MYAFTFRQKFSVENNSQEAAMSFSNCVLGEVQGLLLFKSSTLGSVMIPITVSGLRFIYHQQSYTTRPANTSWHILAPISVSSILARNILVQ